MFSFTIMVRNTVIVKFTVFFIVLWLDLRSGSGFGVRVRVLLGYR